MMRNARARDFDSAFQASIPEAFEKVNMSEANFTFSETQAAEKPERKLGARSLTYDLSAKDDLNILVATDVHYEYKHPKDLENLLKVAKDAKPDVIILAGDTIDYLDDISTPARQAPFRAFLKDLAKVAPVYLGLGNHDQMSKNRKFIPEQADREQQIFLDFAASIPEITLLHNKKVKLSRNINLIGLTLPRSCYQKPYSEATNEDMNELKKVLKANEKLLKKSRKDETNLLLIHSPRRFTPEVLASLPGVDYVITGHMHQGCVPFGLDEVLPGTRGLIAPGYAPFPPRARRTYPSARSRATTPRAIAPDVVPPDATPSADPSPRTPTGPPPATNSAAPALLVLPAYKVFSRSRRPLNLLFPRSVSLLRLKKPQSSPISPETHNNPFSQISDR